MSKEFLLGCHWRGVFHHESASVEAQFRLIKDSGVFDYLDRLPLPDVIDEYLRCSEKYEVPIYTGTYQYMLGRDEDLLRENMRNAARAGLKLHNIMIFTRALDGHVVTNAEIVDCYFRTWELGEQTGVQPSFEPHVNMWSEEFTRVRPVIEMVKSRGLPFNLTLDYSHCIFKIENPDEQDISNVRADVEAGRVVLDPFAPGNQ
jgi:sugar phosphate isomerase/epimerase